METSESKSDNGPCTHLELDVLNEYEFVRKYRCRLCKAIMMCACDRERGTRFLPHQLSHGTELATQQRVAVTHGFLPEVCRECRGLPAIPAPTAAGYGRTSKIKRFYWRELQFREFELLDAAGIRLREHHTPQLEKLREMLTAQALEEIKALHRLSPKYALDTESEASFLARRSVELQNLYAEVLPGGDIRSEHGALCRPEKYASDVLRDEGYEVVLCESRPFHALFAVLLQPLIQDNTDPHLQPRLFGDRSSFEANGASETFLQTVLPTDFGTEGYATRSQQQIEAFFSITLPKDPSSLLGEFDRRTNDASSLRQYLWAHRDEDLESARRIVERLPVESTFAVLRYLIGGYWQNYLGWPDLLASRTSTVLFVEVKLSGDKLSDEQRRWIEANQERLHLPFRLAKIHRRTPAR